MRRPVAIMTQPFTDARRECLLGVPPKCLHHINGIPLLDYVLSFCDSLNVEQFGPFIIYCHINEYSYIKYYIEQTNRAHKYLVDTSKNNIISEELPLVLYGDGIYFETSESFNHKALHSHEFNLSRISNIEELRIGATNYEIWKYRNKHQE